MFSYDKSTAFKRLTVRVCTLILLTPAYAFAEPLFTAEYQGTYGSMNIKMVRTLEQKGNAYSLQSTATSFMAKISEVSQFSNEGELKANSYSYERKIFGVKKNEYLAFNWPKQQVVYTKGKKQVSSKPLAQHTLDPTLYQLQLQQDLVQNPEKKNFNYTFARRNQIKTYHFERQAKEKITFNGQDYSALVLARVKDDSAKETRFWLIPELDYMLAKIQHTEEDGDTYQVLLTRYTNSSSLKAFLTANQSKKTSLAR